MVFQSSTGEQRELHDEWDEEQARVQRLQGKQWLGFTELILGPKSEGFRPRRRIRTTKSETSLKDEELHSTIKEDMQIGLADKDIYFTQRESDSLMKQDISGFDIIFNRGGHSSWQEWIHGPFHHNFSHIV